MNNHTDFIQADGEALRRRIRELERQVAELKEREAALREDDAKFRTLADNAPVMIWLTGTDSLCHYVNKPWLAFTGRTLEQESGYGWLESIHADDRRRSHELYCSSFEARLPFAMTYRLRRADGEYRWILDQGVPLSIADGSFGGYVGSCIDITELKEAELVLRERVDQAQIIEAQQQALRALSTPLIPIAANVVALPLIGELTCDRARQVLETLTRGISAHRARIAIVDITGVSIVDSQAADTLIRSARAARLLGAQVLLTGIRPEVAETLVRLGADLGGIITRGTLRAGIELALGMVGSAARRSSGAARS